MTKLIRQIEVLEKRAASATPFDELKDGIEKIEDALDHLPSLDPSIKKKLEDDLKLLQKHQAELQKELLDATWNWW